jgi:hypothetical protein
MESLRTIRDMAVRAWRLLWRRRTGEVQSWCEFTRGLEAGGYQPSAEVIRRRRAAKRRMAKWAVEREAAGRRAELAERTRAKWGGANG